MSLIGHRPASDFAPGQWRRSNNAQKIEKETRDDINHFAKITRFNVQVLGFEQVRVINEFLKKLNKTEKTVLRTEKLQQMAAKQNMKRRDSLLHPGFNNVTTQEMVKGGNIASVLRYDSLAITNIRNHKENLERIRSTISMKQHSMCAALRGLNERSNMKQATARDRQ